jgi:Ni,Fe-hydrogenase I cytochrome b subunit
MNIKTAAHLLTLIALLLVMAYLWLTPTGNIKPGGFNQPLILMVVGGVISIYLFVENKKEWVISKNPIQVVNMGLATIFLGVHALMMFIIGANLLVK